MFQSQEELADEIAKMIIADITNVTAAATAGLDEDDL